MNHYKDQLLACDFFTVETMFLKTIYVFVFIELGTRIIPTPIPRLAVPSAGSIQTKKALGGIINDYCRSSFIPAARSA